MSYFEHPEYWEKLSYIERIGRLYALNITIFNLLETLCSDILPFVPPDKATIELYSRLRAVFFLALTADEARKLGLSSIVDFPDLSEQKDDLMRHWFDFKPIFKDSLKKLNIEVSRYKYVTDFVSIICKKEILLRIASEKIREYHQEKGSKKRWAERKQPKPTKIDSYPSTFCFNEKRNVYIAGDNKHILHFRKNSVQGKIMKIMDEAKGEYVSTEKISFRTRSKKAKARNAINALKLRIKHDRSVKDRLQIQSKREEGYRLLPIVSTTKKI